MNSEFFPAIVFALTGMVVLAVIATVLRRKAQRRLETLGPAFELGTARRAAPLSNGVVGVYRGYNCRYLIQHQSQYDRGGAVLRLGLYSPQRWSAEQLNAGSRMLIRVGLAKDFEVGDQELDEHFRFSTDSEGDLQSVFSIEKVRETMHLLVGRRELPVNQCSRRPNGHHLGAKKSQARR